MRFNTFGTYGDILEILASEKMITLIDLSRKLQGKVEYNNLSKKVQGLEQKGIIKSFPSGEHKNAKMIHLTHAGIKLTGANYPEVEEATLWHEMVNLNVLKELMRFPIFDQVEHGGLASNNDLAPDGLIIGKKNGVNFKMAIETELTQKSRDRVLLKIVKYLSRNYYDYILYITHKKGVFDSYSGIVEKSSDEIKVASGHRPQDKVMVVLNEKISRKNFKIEESQCFFKGKIQLLEEIFGTVKTGANEVSTIGKTIPIQKRVPP